MEFAQFIKYDVRNIFFFKNPAENETGRLVLDLFLFSKKAFCKVKASDQHHFLFIIKCIDKVCYNEMKK